MNPKFFQLPEEKQQQIINAAYKVFAGNSYKKAPMSEIADECGISKALLFHYFENKKELYLLLWKQAEELTGNAVREFGVMDTTDFFEILEKNLRVKCSLTRVYPYIGAFCLNAYYEQEEEIRKCIQPEFSQLKRIGEKHIFERMDLSVFRKDVDLELMYQEILWTTEGYLCRRYRMQDVDAEEIEKDFLRLIKQWRRIYYKAH